MKSSMFIGIMLASFILMLSAGMGQEAEENVTMPANDSMPANMTDNATMQDNTTIPNNTTVTATTTNEPSSASSSGC